MSPAVRIASVGGGCEGTATNERHAEGRGKVCWRPRPCGLRAAAVTFIFTTIFVQRILYRARSSPFPPPHIPPLDRKCALVFSIYSSLALASVSGQE